MTASERAKQSQYDAENYTGVDNWQDSTLHKGNIVYIWEGDNQSCHYGDGACAMTPNTAFSCDGDPKQLRDSVQTDLNPDYDNHRGVLRAYEMNDDVDAAYSRCEANTCHGNGGGEQYYIPDFDQQLADGKISRREDLDLHFADDMLPIDSEEKSQDLKNIRKQTDESPKQVNEKGEPQAKEAPTSSS